MKKLLLLISFLFCAIVSFAQYGINQSIGNTNTLVSVPGNGGFRAGLINRVYTDTTAANAIPMRFYPGAMIMTITPANTLWLRNIDATGWIQFATGSVSSVNIYNSDGTITGNRVVSGGGNNLFFENIQNFRVYGTGSFNTQRLISTEGLVGAARLGREASSIYFEGSDSLRMVGIGRNADTSGQYKLLLRNRTTGALRDFNWSDIPVTRGVDSIFRVPGKDSIFWVKNAITYSLKDSTGGGGLIFGVSDTLFSANRYVNENEFNFKFKNGNVSLASTDSIGNRLNYSFATNPLSSSVWSTSGTAPTTNGTTTTINGVNTLSSLIKTGAENFTITFTAVTNTKSSVVQSVSALVVPDTLSTVTTRKITWLLADTAGYINFFRNDGATTPLFSNRGYQQLSWAALDTFDFKFIYRPRTVSATMTNRSNGQKSYFEYNINGAVGNVGTIRLITSGNFTYFGNIVYKIDEIARPDFVIVGNSTEEGSGSTLVQTRWVNKLFEKYKNTWAVHAGGGERSAYSLPRIQEIVYNYQPRYVIYGYGVNDLAGGTIAEFSQNTRRFADSMIAHGIGLIFLSLVPQAANVATYNDTIQAIATAKGGQYINITTTLQAGSANFNKNTLYMPTSDLVHLNNTGQQIQADIIADAIQSRLSPNLQVTIDNVPTTNKVAYLLGKDDNNNVVAIQTGLDTSYIRNILYTGGIANAQIADINIDGTANIGGRFQANGNGNDAAPNLLVDAGTVTMSNISVSGGHFTVAGGQTSVNSNWIQFPNGTAYFRTTGNGSLRLKVNISGPGAGSLGVIAGTEGSVPSINYKPFVVQIADSNKAWFDRHGGLVTNINGDAGAMVQFKGDTDTTMFVANAATDRIGLGTIAPTEKLDIRGNLKLGTIGNKILIETGSNASIGTSSALVAGTITVSTTAVTANSKIFLSVATPGGTQGFLSVGTIVPGTSFVINSSGATDTSIVNWWIIN